MNKHLRPVPDEPPIDTLEPDEPSGLPAFEGLPVHLARIKLSGAADLEASPDLTVYHIDDVVQLFVEGQVVRIDHAVDATTGRLKRIATIKISDVLQIPADISGLED